MIGGATRGAHRRGVGNDKLRGRWYRSRVDHQPRLRLERDQRPRQLQPSSSPGDRPAGDVADEDAGSGRIETVEVANRVITLC